MRVWGKLKVDENPGLGRLYRDHGRRPIDGQIDIKILGEYGTIDLTVENLRPLGGDIAAPSGPLAAAASPLAYQVWLVSESEGESLLFGGFNADGDGKGRMGIDFDPSNVCRSGIDINGFDYFAIAPGIEDSRGVAAITIAYARLPGDLATFHDPQRPGPPASLSPGEGKKAETDWEVEIEEQSAPASRPRQKGKRAGKKNKRRKGEPSYDGESYNDSEGDPETENRP